MSVSVTYLIEPGAATPPGFPRVWTDGGAVEMTSMDGPNAVAVSLARLEVLEHPAAGGPWVSTQRVSSVDLTMYITHGRLILHSERWNQRRGTAGIRGTATGLGIFADLRATRERRGRVLVGHVMHRWVEVVYATRQVGAVPAELRCIVRTSGTDVVTVRLDMAIPAPLVDRHLFSLAHHWATLIALARGAPVPPAPDPGEASYTATIAGAVRMGD